MKRLSIGLSEESYRVLNYLASHVLVAGKETTLKKAQAEALRTAISLSNFLHLEVATGSKIILEKDGVRRELVL